ncbi:UNVERIFIED_CONTAM: hypothetical protein K2H54_032950 [Gekko kuhli]
MCGHGGSTNELPEYGIVEEDAKAWETSSPIHGEAITCAPDGRPSDQLLPRPLDNGTSGGDAASFPQELHSFPKEEETVQLVDSLGESGGDAASFPQELHSFPTEEGTVQLVDSLGESREDAASFPQELHSFPKEEETVQLSGNLENLLMVSQVLEDEEPQVRENNAFGSEIHMENESCVGRAVEEVARGNVLADRETPLEIPLPDLPAERKLYWITEEDSTMVLTVEIQPEASQETEEAHKSSETYGHRPLEGTESKTESTTGILHSAWANFEQEFSVHDSDKMDKTPERRLSEEMAVSKHVEFQGVEILWIQKAGEEKGTGHFEVNSLERRSFSRIPNDHTSSTASSSLVGLPESSCSGSWESLRPLASLAEGGEDEVFVEEGKKEEKSLDGNR